MYTFVTKLMSFQDHFSKQSSQYAQYRPDYPLELYEFIFRHVENFEYAWDCATGNGQAARVLANFFRRVEATDASQQQILEAPTIKNVHYQVAEAEASIFADRIFDLITVAQALHWFDHPRFFAQVKRVAREGAIFAAWGYQLFRCEPSINEIIDHLYSHILGAYWPLQRHILEHGYADISIPFTPLPSQDFSIQRTWTFAELIGYLSTWSAVVRYTQKEGRDPLQLIHTDLAKAWEDLRQPKVIIYPLFLQLFRI